MTGQGRDRTPGYMVLGGLALVFVAAAFVGAYADFLAALLVLAAGGGGWWLTLRGGWRIGSDRADDEEVVEELRAVRRELAEQIHRGDQLERRLDARPEQQDGA